MNSRQKEVLFIFFDEEEIIKTYSLPGYKVEIYITDAIVLGTTVLLVYVASFKYKVTKVNGLCPKPLKKNWPVVIKGYSCLLRRL